MPSRLTFDPPLDPTAYSFTHRLRPRFAETDAMGVIHHSAYLVYLEEARVEYLRALGHPYEAVRAEGVDFSVIEVAVRYRSPLRFDEPLDVHVVVAGARAATFQVGYLLAVGDEPRATAVTAHGAVDMDGRATRIPRWLRDVLPAPATTGG